MSKINWTLNWTEQKLDEGKARQRALPLEYIKRVKNSNTLCKSVYLKQNLIITVKNSAIFAFKQKFSNNGY